MAAAISGRMDVVSVAHHTRGYENWKSTRRQNNQEPRAERLDPTVVDIACIDIIAL